MTFTEKRHPATRRAVKRAARWLAAALAAALVCLAATRELARARGFQLFGRLVDRVDTTEPLVALTFDDGRRPPRWSRCWATWPRARSRRRSS